MNPKSAQLKQQLKLVMTLRGGVYEYPELMDDKNPLKKYLLALAIAKDNLAYTNKNANCCLINNWCDTTGKGLTIKLMADNKLKYNNTLDGQWNYNPEKGLLTISSQQRKDKVYIIITQLLPGSLNGIIYSGTDYKNSEEIFLKPEAE
jgi:hypothetical protein